MARKINGNRKNHLIIIFLFIIAFFIGSFVYARAFKSVAQVNGERITRVKYIQELEKQAGKRVLDGMITKTLIYQIAEDKKIEVTDTEIDDEIKKIEDNLKKQKTILDQVLKAQNMTRDDLYERITLNKLSQKLVEKNVKVTDAEVESYINTNPAIFPQRLVSIAIKNQVKEEMRQQKMNEQIQILLTNARKKSKIDIYLQ